VRKRPQFFQAQTRSLRFGAYVSGDIVAKVRMLDTIFPPQFISHNRVTEVAGELIVLAPARLD